MISLLKQPWYAEKRVLVRSFSEVVNRHCYLHPGQ
jgi:hypothetical protein